VICGPPTGSDNKCQTHDWPAPLAFLQSILATRWLEIELRNIRVEREKSWEVSWARFLCNSAATYLTMNLVLWTIGVQNPPTHAVVPTVGYVLSSLSIPKFKDWWISQTND